MRGSGAVTLLAALVFAHPATGQLLPLDGSSPIAVKSHRVEAIVEDGLARTTVRQTFVNPHDRPLEAIYVFPLPEAAALVDVAMEVGGQRLAGLLTERKRARRIYDDIVRKKRDPALVEQIGRSLFRLSVFPVMPHQETLVELSWIQPVPLTQGAFRYVYPLALGRQAATTQQDFSVIAHLHSAVPITRVTASRDDVLVVQTSPLEATASLEESAARPGPGPGRDGRGDRPRAEPGAAHVSGAGNRRLVRRPTSSRCAEPSRQHLCHLRVCALRGR